MSSGGSRASSTPPAPAAEPASLFEGLEARLAALKTKMVRGLPDRATELDQASTRLRGGDVTGRDELRRQGHKLRGVAGSYGFSALRELAARLETLANDQSVPAVEVLACAQELAAAARHTADEAGGDSHAAPAHSTPQAAVPLVVDTDAPKTVRAVDPIEGVSSSEGEPTKRRPIPAAPALEGLQVLAADDDDATRRLLEITLLQLGRMRGALFDRGPALLAELAQRDRVDLVVVDAMMPDMNGVELLHAAVARGLSTRVGRFVVLSAATAEELGWTLPPGLEVGWLRKPFRPKELLAALADLRGEVG